MSIDYNFTHCEVEVQFNNEQEMQEKIKAFEEEVQEYNENDIYIPAYISQKDDDKKELKARVIASDSKWVDTDELAKLICKHFPTANGDIGWADAEESAGGYVRFADGGTTHIKDGKVLPTEWEQIKELKDDIGELLEYISEVVSNGDITDCGVSHLFKKYAPEDYEQALKDKEE